ncbi:MAG: hypothetical protein ACO1RX_01490 [Candidatus Sericytochromatia bacterium]
MSNFQMNVPASLKQSWQQLTADKVFNQADLQSLRQTAAATQGSPLQEALETQTLDVLNQKLQIHRGSMNLDSVIVNEGAGHATVSIQIVDRPAGFVAPTQTEVDWAMQLEQRVNQPAQPGVPPYRPSAEDQRQYEDIMARLIRSKADLPAPTRADLEWAAELGRSMQQKQYRPSDLEMKRYQDITLRQLAQVQKELEKLPAPTQPPTQQDMTWAQSFHQQVKVGLKTPTVQETVRFQQIVLAFQKFQTVR